MNNSINRTEASSRRRSRVRVIGIGDTGVRTASAMTAGLSDLAEVICIDTDSTSLRRVSDAKTILVGEQAFHGFGSGGDVKAAEQCAQEEIVSLYSAVAGAKSVVILAGMGGGTGSGVAPIVAAVAKASGAHTFSIVSMPFDFEGIRRDAIAQEALERVKAESDAVAPLSNDRLIVTNGAGCTMAEALTHGRKLNAELVRAFASVFSPAGAYSQVTPGHILSVLSNSSLAYTGTGEGSGPAASSQAAEAALDSSAATAPEQADRAVVLIESGPELSLAGVAAAMGTIQARLGEDAELHMGIRKSRKLTGTVKVTVLASYRERRRPVIVADREVRAQVTEQRKLAPMFG